MATLNGMAERFFPVEVGDNAIRLARSVSHHLSVTVNLKDEIFYLLWVQVFIRNVLGIND